MQDEKGIEDDNSADIKIDDDFVYDELDTKENKVIQNFLGNNKDVNVDDVGIKGKLLSSLNEDDVPKSKEENNKELVLLNDINKAEDVAVNRNNVEENFQHEGTKVSIEVLVKENDMNVVVNINFLSA